MGQSAYTDAKEWTERYLNKKWEVTEKEMDTGWNQQISITVIYFILNGHILTGMFLPNQFFWETYSVF